VTATFPVTLGPDIRTFGFDTMYGLDGRDFPAASAGARGYLEGGAGDDGLVTLPPGEMYGSAGQDLLRRFGRATTDGPRCNTAALFWIETRGGWREAPPAHESSFKPASGMSDEALAARIRGRDRQVRPRLVLRPVPTPGARPSVRPS
jgi:hypothetical protein